MHSNDRKFRSAIKSTRGREWCGVIKRKRVIVSKSANPDTSHFNPADKYKQLKQPKSTSDFQKTKKMNLKVSFKLLKMFKITYKINHNHPL